MDRKFALVILVCALATLFASGMQPALAESRVGIVVAGYINHGPMQPTLDAIMNVTSKYGDRVEVSWLDMDTAEGRSYMSEHGLSAHLNVVIDGKYQYAINGKTVTFQWFEGQQWTKNDLDDVISDLLSGTGQAVAQTPAPADSGILILGAAALIACAAAGVGYVLYRKKRKV